MLSASGKRSLLLMVVALFPLTSFAQTFSSIVTGIGYQGGELQVIGLGASDGAAHLAAWQDSSGTWHPGGALPGQGTRFSALVTGTGNVGELQIIGLGAADGHAYLAAWQDTSGAWHSGGILPGQSTQFSSIVTGVGNPSGELQVVGLGAEIGRAHV